jgi:hypothetical protein
MPFDPDPLFMRIQALSGLLGYSHALLAASAWKRSSQ